MTLKDGNTIKDGLVYDKTGKYMGHADLVYGNRLGGMTAPNDSEATSNAQPSKSMNSGSATIDGANPNSPSTNPATRRAEYNSYASILNGQPSSGNQTASDLSKPQSNTVTTPDIKTTQPAGVDLTIKGNFDVYNPIDWQNQPELMQQYYVQANNDIKASKRTLSQLILQQDALESKSSNINEVTTLIDAIENAYDRGVFDAETIAKTLGVDVNTVKLIQQGKANELVKLNEEYVQDQLKTFYRAEEDYDTNLARTMQDYQLAKTNLDQQYNSAMQTLKRNLFDEKRAASVGGAVAGISGSEYAVSVIEKKHQQNMDDLENNYLYSSTKQKYSYTRAIEDYNKNIKRLSEDFDDALKEIQAGVLQQFQEIDNKIGLTTAQLAKAYGTLEQNVITAKSAATSTFLEALSNNENELANAIANTYGIDQGDITLQKFGESIRTGDTIGNDVNSIGHILNSNDGLRIGTYTNSKGYTYNVYATREDGLKATIQLLKRGYYGMTLADAAQKWIGKGKDISVAKTVMAKNGLKLTDKLSDANVEKFIQAMGQWEGTLKNGKTLEQWLQEGRTLGTSPTATTQGGTTQGGTNTGYDPAKAPLYESYLQGKYANIKDFISDPQFQAEALAYQATKTPGIIDGYQQSLDTMVEFKNRYNQLTDKEKEVISVISPKDIQEGGFRQNSALTDNQKNVLSLYNQIKAQLFIDGIVASKKKGAAYGNLSDAEGNRISNAQSNLNVNTPSYVNYNIDKMIRDLVEDIESIGGKADTSRGYSDPSKKSPLDLVFESVRNITNGPAIPETSKSNFNTQGTYQTNNNTGTVINPVMNF